MIFRFQSDIYVQARPNREALIPYPAYVLIYKWGHYIHMHESIYSIRIHVRQSSASRARQVSAFRLYA